MCEFNHRWHEDDDETGCLQEEFCNLLNGIQSGPDAERKLAIIEMILTDPVELENIWARVGPYIEAARN
jgi:hypothetical protein